MKSSKSSKSQSKCISIVFKCLFYLLSVTQCKKLSFPQAILWVFDVTWQQHNFNPEFVLRQLPSTRRRLRQRCNVRRPERCRSCTSTSWRKALHRLLPFCFSKASNRLVWMLSENFVRGGSSSKLITGVNLSWDAEAFNRKLSGITSNGPPFSSVSSTSLLATIPLQKTHIQHRVMDDCIAPCSSQRWIADA